MARANEQLRELAIKDSLTGLANRAFLSEALRLALHQRLKGRPGLLFCDMDGFKQVNDRCGHQAGDELLQLIANRLSETVAQPAVIAGHTLTPQVSVGAALADFGETPAALLQRADAAMYRDKGKAEQLLRT